MRIAVAREADPAEDRVAATPDTVKKLKSFGADVAVEPGAGVKSGIPDADFTAAGIAIIHLKAIMQSPEGYVKAASCANGQEPDVEGNLDASPAEKHSLLLNLRAIGEAQEVQAIVESNLGKIRGRLEQFEISCFHPAPPNPERRVAKATA